MRYYYNHYPVRRLFPSTLSSSKCLLGLLVYCTMGLHPDIKKDKFLFFNVLSCPPSRIRTYDLTVKSRLLYQLSYGRNS